MKFIYRHRSLFNIVKMERNNGELVDKSGVRDTPSPDFITVGIGASAGGIEPLKQLFSKIPPNAGMAYVVVLHLSPKHISHLTEILQLRTPMPVIEVSEQVKVIPDHVYVISPTKDLILTDGHISPTDRGKKIGPRVAIDLLFNTLADAYRGNGVCVLLSGTGADGTTGLKHIKERNGFAIVQDPNEAEYDDMPRSAIKTNLVDWILPVVDIPAQLIRLKEITQWSKSPKTLSGDRNEFVVAADTPSTSKSNNGGHTTLSKISRPVNNASVPGFSEVHYKLVEKLAPPSILITADLEILHMSESVGRYLHLAGGERSNDLLKVIHPDLLSDLKAALHLVQHNGMPSEIRDVRVNLEGRETGVDIAVHRAGVEDLEHDFMLVVLGESGLSTVLKESNAQRNVCVLGADAALTVKLQLDDDLRRSREQLLVTIEQFAVSTDELKVSNDKLLNLNEELRSASEELETSKEELQSVNEELTTVNFELKEKFDETGRINSDLQNLMASAEVGTIFLDRSLQIKIYTRSIPDLFNIIPTDIGRPLNHITHKLAYKTLAVDSSEVLQTLEPIESEIRTNDGRILMLRILPYRNFEDRIDGVILTFKDITEQTAIEVALGRSEDRFSRLFSSIDEGFCFIEVLFDDRKKPVDYRFLEYNPAFEKLTCLKDGIGKSALELVPDLEYKWIEIYGRVALTGKSVRFEDFSAPMNRWFDVHASSIEDHTHTRVALIFTDITDRKRAELALRASRELNEKVINSMSANIAVLDAAGTIRLVNDS